MYYDPKYLLIIFTSGTYKVMSQATCFDTTEQLDTTIIYRLSTLKQLFHRW